MGVAEEREYVRNFINDNCIVRVEPGSRALPSYQNQGSGYYTWQFYLRQSLFNPRVLNFVVQDFLLKFKEPIENDAVQLCGVESASTPLLTAIAIACSNRGCDLNVFSIRKEQKPYGKRNWVEGRVLPNKVAVIVDDLTSPTHKTSIHAASVLYNESIPIADRSYAMVFKSDTPENNVLKLLGRNVTLSSTFSLNDFNMSLKSYQQRNWITPDPAG